MSKADATHTSIDGKSVYKVVEDYYGSSDPDFSDRRKYETVYFWDKYCNKYRRSIMLKFQLIELQINSIKGE